MSGSAQPANEPQILGPDGRVINREEFVASQIFRTRLRAVCKISVAGQDVTSRLDPLLLSVRITDREMGASEVEIELDDAYGKIPSPPDGASVSVDIGWQGESRSKTFDGAMNDVISSGSRRGGRTLIVQAQSMNMLGAGKTRLSRSWGDGNEGEKGDEGKTFDEIATEIGRQMGVVLRIAPSIGQIKRKFWEIQNESPASWLERMATELGGAFKVEGSNAGIVDLKSKQNAVGKDMPSLDCIVGQNVMGWRIRPKVARSQWGELARGFFDRDKAEWLVESNKAAAAFGFGGFDKALHMASSLASNPDVAKQTTLGDATYSVKNRGTGWIAIDGDARAAALAFIKIHGARIGVDGQYRNSEVEHLYLRGGGWITRCDVNSPELFDGSDLSGAWSKPGQ